MLYLLGAQLCTQNVNIEAVDGAPWAPSDTTPCFITADEIKSTLLEVKKEINDNNSDILLLSRDAAARQELENGRLKMHVVSCDIEKLGDDN